MNHTNYSMVSNLLGYTLPRYHEGNYNYIDFKCLDPLSGKLKRKKISLDGVYGLRERRQQAAEIIAAVTAKLKSGWNCWIDEKAAKQYTKLEEVNKLYTLWCSKMFRIGSMRKNTYYDYKSRHKIFCDWLASDVPGLMYAYQLDTVKCTEFLEYIFMKRDVSTTSRNNYKGWLGGFCNWMRERGYLSENPVEGIRKLAETPKERDAFTPQELQRVRAYLLETNKPFYVACAFEYYLMIRPIELVQLQLKHIRISEQVVFVPGTISKNKKDYAVALNSDIVSLMLELGYFSHPSDEYIFGGPDFLPSSVMQSERIFRDYWAKIRKALGLKSSLQFYSFKDAGIRDLANTQGIVVARDQARHSDVATTNRYLKGEHLTVHEETKHFRGSF